MRLARLSSPCASISLLIAAVLLAPAAPAEAAPSAQGGARKTKPAAGKSADGPAAPSPEEQAALEALARQLRGGEDEAVAALGQLGPASPPGTAALLAELLQHGGSEKVLGEALRAAGKLKAPELSAAIAPYLRHRTEDLRRGAARALGRTGGPDAVAALRSALRSGDAVVRGVGASGLGALGAREAVPDLFRALDHGVSEAAAAIGQIGTPEDVARLLERAGKVAFDVMSAAYDQILFRPAAEIPDATKLTLIGQLREAGTAECARYLRDVADRWPADWSKKVKAALEAAARSIAGGGK